MPYMRLLTVNESPIDVNVKCEMINSSNRFTDNGTKFVLMLFKYCRPSSLSLRDCSAAASSRRRHSRSIRCSGVSIETILFLNVN